MRSTTSLSGKIIRLNFSDTRFGVRAEVHLEHIDWSTGEVTTHVVVGWDNEAHALSDAALGGEVGVSGSWRKRDSDGIRRFNARSVSRLRHIDPRSVDLSAYL